MVYCQVINEVGVIGVECFPVAPIKGDYISLENKQYLVVDRVITPVTDTRHIILFVKQQKTENEVVLVWQSI